MRPAAVVILLLLMLALAACAEVRDGSPTCSGRQEGPPCGPGVEMGQPYPYTLGTMNCPAPPGRGRPDWTGASPYGS